MKSKLFSTITLSFLMFACGTNPTDTHQTNLEQNLNSKLASAGIATDSLTFLTEKPSEVTHAPTQPDITTDIIECLTPIQDENSCILVMWEKGKIISYATLNSPCNELSTAQVCQETLKTIVTP